MIEMTRALILYDSLFGNTKKVAISLASGIKENGIEVNCLNINEIDCNTISTYNFIAIGGPTHNIGLSKQMKTFLQGLEKIKMPGIKGFCFDTRYHSRLNKKRWLILENSAARKIERKMKAMKVQIIKSRQSALVEKGRKGPLLQGVENNFKNIGKEIGMILS